MGLLSMAMGRALLPHVEGDRCQLSKMKGFITWWGMVLYSGLWRFYECCMDEKIGQKL